MDQKGIDLGLKMLTSMMEEIGERIKYSQPIKDDTRLKVLAFLIEQHKPYHDIGKICFQVLVGLTEHWDKKVIPFPLIDVLMEPFNDVQQKYYLSHCGQDKRLKLMLHVLKQTNINDLSLIDMRTWGPKNKEVLRLFIAKQERKMIGGAVDARKKQKKTTKHDQRKRM